MSVRSKLFNLYQKEKIVTISDGESEVKILFVKPTQGQRQEVLEEYSVHLAKTKAKLTEQEKNLKIYTRSVDLFDKASLIAGIMQYQMNQRKDILDLFPIENEADLSDEDKKKAQDELINKWEADKKKELEGTSLEALQKMLRDVTIESIAIVQSSKFLDLVMLSKMCMDPDTKEPLFKDGKDVENIIEARVMDELIKELNDFRAAENGQAVRTMAEDKTFLSNGESPKNSVDSQSTTPVTSPT